MLAPVDGETRDNWPTVETAIHDAGTNSKKPCRQASALVREWKGTSPLSAQNRGGHAAGHDTNLGPGDLRGGLAPELTHALAGEIEAVDGGFGQMTARRIEWQPPRRPTDVAFGNKLTARAATAEAERFESHKNEGCEVIVDLNGVDVVSGDPCLGIKLLG